MKRKPDLRAVTPTHDPVFFPAEVKTAPGAKQFVLQPGETVEVDVGDPWVVKQLQARKVGNRTFAAQLELVKAEPKAPTVKPTAKVKPTPKVKPAKTRGASA